MRDALEECADVSSELWNGDMSQRLLMMLSHQQLDVTRSHDQVEPKEHVVDDKTPEPVEAQADFDFSLACLTQNRSVRFDGAGPVLPNYEPITPDDSLTQLYGSAWKSAASV
ncbi:unnamed protein product [Echinostoma caproni]|uniref:Uncharacterized protein n=1 Tax=Echinostoma caproni TaxID=27848 RepID=A0A3P8CDQ2_9TREM|nr:unnamed protein product [Echinostoma caproni]